jgi:hypothetical protein
MLSWFEADRVMTKILVISALVSFLGLHAVVTAVTLYPEAPFADACDGSNC